MTGNGLYENMPLGATCSYELDDKLSHKLPGASDNTQLIIMDNNITCSSQLSSKAKRQYLMSNVTMFYLLTYYNHKCDTDSMDFLMRSPFNDNVFRDNERQHPYPIFFESIEKEKLILPGSF